MKIMFRIVGGLLGAFLLFGCASKLYVLLLVQAQTATPSPGFWVFLGVQLLLGLLFTGYALRPREEAVRRLPSVYGYDQPIPPTRSQPYV